MILGVLDMFDSLVYFLFRDKFMVVFEVILFNVESDSNKRIIGFLEVMFGFIYVGLDVGEFEVVMKLVKS